jgi:hypothetical protein
MNSYANVIIAPNTTLSVIMRFSFKNNAFDNQFCFPATSPARHVAFLQCHFPCGRLGSEIGLLIPDYKSADRASELQIPKSGGNRIPSALLKI